MRKKGTDIQTKNVAGSAFKQHCEVYYGTDEYWPLKQGRAFEWVSIVDF